MLVQVKLIPTRSTEMSALPPACPILSTTSGFSCSTAAVIFANDFPTTVGTSSLIIFTPKMFAYEQKPLLYISVSINNTLQLFLYSKIMARPFLIINKNMVKQPIAQKAHKRIRDKLLSVFIGIYRTEYFFYK